MESAYLPIFASLPQPTREQEIAWSRAGQMLYIQAGITKPTKEQRTPTSSRS